MTFVKYGPGALTTLRAMRQLLPSVNRRHLCAWLVGALLMAQWLVAAHACPTVPVQAPALTTVSMGIHAAPCHEQLAAGRDAVCEAQCEAEQPLPSVSMTPDAPVPVAGWCMVLALPALTDQVDARPLFATAHAAAPPGWPPLYIRLGVLRI